MGGNDYSQLGLILQRALAICWTVSARVEGVGIGGSGSRETRMGGRKRGEIKQCSERLVGREGRVGMV